MQSLLEEEHLPFIKMLCLFLRFSFEQQRWMEFAGLYVAVKTNVRRNADNSS